MKKYSCYLLISVCCFLLIGCANPLLKSSTATAIYFNPPVIEINPITAELLVTEEKGSGEAVGNILESERLIREATAKALNQDPPSVDGADALIGMDVFYEARGKEMKVTVTGYHAYYTNFHSDPGKDTTAAEKDSLRRLEYAEMYAISKTLRDMADEDSGRVVVSKNGNNKAFVKISYPAKNVEPLVETIKNNDGSLTETTTPIYHTLEYNAVFDVQTELGQGKKKRSGTSAVTGTDNNQAARSNNKQEKKPGGSSSGGAAKLIGLGGAVLMLLGFIL